MPPPRPRAPRPKAVVLDEDDWTSSIEAIIERDFFPELPKLQSKVEWLEAIRSADPERIRAAQLSIAARQLRAATPGGRTPLFTPGGTAARLVEGAALGLHAGASSQLRRAFTPSGATPATGATPGTDRAHYTPASASAAAHPHPHIADQERLSLDDFMARYTSEDNASFDEVMERVNKRRRMARATRLPPPVSDPRAVLALPAASAGRDRTDGLGTTGQPTDTLAGWRYEPRTLLMYNGATRPGLELSAAELAAQAQGPPKEIRHAATRFAAAPGGASGSAPDSGASTPSLAPTPSRGRPPRLLAGGGTTPQRSAAAAGGTSGYGILGTPSFEPGVDASPFVTWGDIEGTPLRIEAEDLPAGGAPGAPGSSGAAFRMAQPPDKERRAHALAARAATSLRHKASARRGGLTPRAGAGVGQPGGTPLSAAARRLATQTAGGSRARPETDLALRASYAPVAIGGSSMRVGAPSAAATPAHSARGWTPGGGGTPALQRTLQSEARHVEAAMRGGARGAPQHATAPTAAPSPQAAGQGAVPADELAAAREAALAAFKAHSASGGDTQPGPGVGGNLTDGLLNI